MLPESKYTNSNFFTRYFQNACGLDLRALAVYRILISLILLLDLFVRLTYVRAHYSDWGLLPRNAVLEFKNLTYAFSLHFISGTAIYQTALILLTMIFVLMMLCGVKTRLASILTWILIVSLHNRNPAVLNGGDSLLRLLLFWGMFLPLGARFSVDAAYAKDEHRGFVCNVASFGFIIQIVFLYVFTGILKDSTLWWPKEISTFLEPVSSWYPNGSALYYALSIDQFTTTFGYWMLEQRTLLPLFTAGTYILELFGPLLFFVPVGFALFRTIGVLSFIGLHLGIVLMMKVGWFPLIDVAALIAILPSAFWDKLTPWFQQGIKSLRASLIDTCPMTLKAVFKGGFHSSTTTVRPHMVTNLLLSFILAYFLALNVQSVKKWKYKAPEILQPIEQFLMSYQYWSMFAPFPMKDDGWYVIRGELDDGRTADVWNRTIGPVSDAKPNCVSCNYQSQRWRKYMMNLRRKKYEKYRLYFGKYLCRRWNDNPPDGKKLMTFKIHYMVEKTLPNYKTSNIRKRQLWRHYCFKKPD